jgi:hypothetical protein
MCVLTIQKLKTVKMVAEHHFVEFAELGFLYQECLKDRVLTNIWISPYNILNE